jgi:hypothetical protein
MQDAPMERWREVAGFPAYEVSDCGRVRRRDTQSLLALGVRNGYVVVCLWRDNKRKGFSVHRLVALAFIGEPPSARHDVAHWDGNRANNCSANLRWATRSENQLDSVRLGTHGGFRQRGERHPRAILTADQVNEVRQLWPTLSFSRIAERFGVSRSAVRGILNGSNWKHLAV